MSIPQIIAIAKIVSALNNKDTISPFPDNATVPISTAIAIAAWALSYIMEKGEKSD